MNTRKINFYGSELPVFKAALHTHSTNSDGTFSPEQLIYMYANAGYDVLAFTDHRKTNPVSAYDGKNMTLLSGAELHPMGPHGQRWHLLALGIPENFPCADASCGQEAVDAVKSAGGALFLAHPHWSGFSAADLMTLHGYDGIEIYNTSARRIGKGSNDQCWQDMMNSGDNSPAIAVDDIHHPGDLFGGWTMIAAPDNSPESLLNALKNGNFYSTQGPEFTRLEMKGNVFEAEFSEAVEAVLISKFSAGRMATVPDWPFPGDRKTVTSMRIELPPEFPGVVRCKITDANGKSAWSNPLVFK